MNVKSKTIRSYFKSLRNNSIVVRIAIFVIVFFVFLSVFAPILTPYSPTQQSLLEKMEKPSAKHLLGTDNLGRDVLTRLIYGARVSLSASLLSGVIAAVFGMFLGLLAGYLKNTFSAIILRINDAQLSLPPIILIMVLSSLFGGGIKGVGIVIGISMMPTYIRMMYGMVLSLRDSDYVCAAKLLGKNDLFIMLKHLLPNCYPSLIVLFTMNLGSSILIEASLSYLGMGITPPTPAWGSMVSEGYRYIVTNPRLAILPGICVILIVVAFNIAGDALRDKLDPRLKGKI